MMTEDLPESKIAKYARMIGASFTPGGADIASQMAKDAGTINHIEKRGALCKVEVGSSNDAKSEEDGNV